MKRDGIKWPMLILLGILALFLVTRLYKIGNIPESVYWDEASIGYNAYSVLETGHDEWGEFLPFHFRAFGEFKLPVYVYSVIPFVKLFGLNSQAVRLPAVFFSLGTIVFTYLLALKLTRKKLVPLFSAFFLVVTPWLFIFSRTGYEATAGLMFFVLAIYLYKKVRDNSWYFLASTAALLLSAYSYNSFRIMAPFVYFSMLADFLIVKKPGVKKYYSVAATSLFLVILAVIPAARLIILDTGLGRFQSVGLEGTIIQKMTAFAGNYLSHFSLDFLYFVGDSNLRSQLPGFGQLYIVSFPLLVFGFLSIVKDKKMKNLIPIIALILLGIVPPSLTREAPHGLRAIATLPFLAILASFGLEFFAGMYKKHRGKVIIAVVVIYLAFFELYLDRFIRVYPALSSVDWQSGSKRLFLDYENEFEKYEKVVISDEYAQPYIFALFYLKYPPEVFREEVVFNEPGNWGFSTVKSFSNFEFRKVKEEDIGKGYLVFATREDKPDIKLPKSEILFRDNSVAYWVYEE